MCLPLVRLKSAISSPFFFFPPLTESFSLKSDRALFAVDDHVPLDDMTPRESGSLSLQPKHTTHLPSKFNDFVDSDIIAQQLLSLDTDGSELDFAIEENSPFFSLIHSLASSDAILCSLQDDDACNPQTIAEAKRSKYWTNWLAAIHEELKSLKTKGVYEEVSSVPWDRKAVQCKWVLHIKWDKDSTISRFKARLVAKGFTQIPGQDFTFTFAPVACWKSICSLLCIATVRDYENTPIR
jgi:hypothetical protein